MQIWYPDDMIPLWCVENNGDPEHHWWAQVLIFTPSGFIETGVQWFDYLALIAKHLQKDLNELGVPTARLIWGFGDNKPIPTNPEFFDKRKFN